MQKAGAAGTGSGSRSSVSRAATLSSDTRTCRGARQPKQLQQPEQRNTRMLCACGVPAPLRALRQQLLRPVPLCICAQRNAGRSKEAEKRWHSKEAAELLITSAERAAATADASLVWAAATAPARPAAAASHISTNTGSDLTT